MPDTELSGDEWTFPRPLKTKLDHVFPLSGAARDLLASIPRIKGVKWIFTTDTEPIRGFTKSKVDFDEVCGVTGWTLHDLRRTSRSLMSRGRGCRSRRAVPWACHWRGERDS